jgi:hypothetical protein
MDTKDILNESLADLAKNNFDDSLIKDNKLCFILDEKLFRVRMPTQGEQSLTEQRRNLAQLEYVKQDGCITKSQLIKQLKENKVVDIEALESTKEDLTKDLKKYWFLLATKDSGDKAKLEEYSEKISKIQTALQNIAMDIATYLCPSLESRLEKFYIEYMTSLCAEEQIKDKWVKIWETFDDFNSTNSPLTNKATTSMTWLLLNRR